MHIPGPDFPKLHLLNGIPLPKHRPIFSPRGILFQFPKFRGMVFVVAGLVRKGTLGAMRASLILHPPWRRCPSRLLGAAPPPRPGSSRRNSENARGGSGRAGSVRAGSCPGAPGARGRGRPRGAGRRGRVRRKGGGYCFLTHAERWVNEAWKWEWSALERKAGTLLLACRSPSGSVCARTFKWRPAVSASIFPIFRKVRA